MLQDFRQFDAYVEAHAGEYVARLQALCRVPSVSAAGGPAMAEAARLAAELAASAGLQVEVFAADGRPPVILGRAGQGPRGLLIYNHYDVQPPEPFDEWRVPPFDAQIVDGALVARGAADNKGNLVARLAALEAYRAVAGELPLRAAFVIEGEEEVGSEVLAPFGAAHAALLRTLDGCVWESGGKDAAERDVITLGLKGVVCLLVRARVMARDAHSAFGGLYPNAAWRLVEALNTLAAADGRVMIDGLWEHVLAPSPAEEAALQALPFEDAAVQQAQGIAGFLGGLAGADALRRLMFEPTCSINGIWGGHTGQGSKTVIPSQAAARLDVRLVPNLTPALVLDLVRSHLARRGFTDVEVVEEEAGLMPARSDPAAAIVQAAIAALTDVRGRAPVVRPTSPGSGPMYQLCQAYGIPAVSLGVGWAHSNAHAPNESVRLADFVEGIKVIGRLVDAFARA